MPRALLFLSVCVFVIACSDADSTGVAVAAAPTPETASASSPPEEESRSRFPENLEKQLGIPVLSRSWTGDLDGMVERRLIRVLTVYGLPRYFLDGAREQGITYEQFMLFEKYINERFSRDGVKIYVVFIPVARDELIQGLVAGHGDIAAAGLTITPERQALVDFTKPLTRPLSEVLVTGPSAPAVDSVEDLGGKEIYVRASSSYRSSLEALNRRLREQGAPEVVLRDVSEHLEDEDLLEMVNSGMLPWTVVDDYKANSWAEVFSDLVVRRDLVLREGGRLGYAVRKNSPQLLAALNEFIADHKEGSLTGNILINRYIRDFDWSKNALALDDYERFERVVGIFEKYGEQYGLDYLLVTAQGYQESRLDQSVRSKAGAVGIMQMLPTTARDPKVGIPDISKADRNIHAGIKYLNFIREQYFGDLADDRFNQTLFALASYNAGPARIRSLRAKAEEQGYDPNRWFDNVEVVAAREVGEEPVTYVANILKYYVAYSLSVSRQHERAVERDQFESKG
jgi:membrane-bound lytic murein transglycosylase MltF